MHMNFFQLILIMDNTLPLMDDINNITDNIFSAMATRYRVTVVERANSVTLYRFWASQIHHGFS